MDVGGPGCPLHCCRQPLRHAADDLGIGPRARSHRMDGVPSSCRSQSYSSSGPCCPGSVAFRMGRYLATILLLSVGPHSGAPASGAAIATGIPRGIGVRRSELRSARAPGPSPGPLIGPTGRRRAPRSRESPGDCDRRCRLTGGRHQMNGRIPRAASRCRDTPRVRRSRAADCTPGSTRDDPGLRRSRRSRRPITSRCSRPRRLPQR